MIGDARGLAWILREHRMAFPTHGGQGTHKLAKGDELFLVTTRNCYGRSGTDRTRIIGKAHASSDVIRFDEPLKLAGRRFDRGCDLTIETIAPFGTGLELQPLVPDLDVFPNKRAWGWSIRRSLVRLPAKDTQVLARHMTTQRGVPDKSIPPEYLRWIDGHPEGHPRLL